MTSSGRRNGDFVQVFREIAPLLHAAWAGSLPARKVLNERAQDPDTLAAIELIEKLLQASEPKRRSMSLNDLLLLPSTPSTRPPGTLRLDTTHLSSSFAVAARCSVCGEPAIPGDDRCLLHIK